MTFAERTAQAKKKAQEIDNKMSGALLEAGITGTASTSTPSTFAERAALARQRAAAIDGPETTKPTFGPRLTLGKNNTLDKLTHEPGYSPVRTSTPVKKTPATANERIQTGVILPKKAETPVASGAASSTDFIKQAATANNKRAGAVFGVVQKTPGVKTDVLDLKKTTTTANERIQKGVTLSEADKNAIFETRKSTLEKQIKDATARNAALSQARSALPAAQQQEYDANNLLIQTAQKELTKLERGGATSLNDEYSQNLEDASTAEGQSGADLAKIASQARVGNADTIGESIDEAAKEHETDVAQVEAAKRNIQRVDYVNDKAGRQYEDKFSGQFGANYNLGRLTQDQSLAWNEYLANPTAENKAFAQAIDQLITQFQTNNVATLDDDAQTKWISKSLANYLPQLADQLKYEAVGALIGGGLGTLVGQTANGAKLGVIVASGTYSYQTMRGAAFKNLLDLGVSEDVARAAANDEAVLSSAIEMADTGIDLATLGAGTLLNAVTKGGFKILAKKGSEWAAEKAWKKLGIALAKYGINILSEGVQEETQEAVSVANENRVASSDTDSSLLAGATDVFVNDYIKGDDKAVQSRIAQAGAEGRRIAAMLGGTTIVSTQIVQQGATVLSDALSNKAELKTVAALPDETRRALLEMGIMVSEIGSDNMTALSDALTKLNSEEGLSAKEFLGAWKRVSFSPETVAGALSDNENEANYSQTQLENPTTTVLDLTASTLVKTSDMSAEDAQMQAGLLNKVFAGQSLNHKELRQLDVTNPAVQSILTAQTGVEISSKDAKNAPAMRAIFKSAIKQVAEIQAQQQDLAAANDTIVSKLSNQNEGTVQQAVAEKLTEIPGATVEQAEQLVQRAPLNAMTNQSAETVTFSDGSTATKAQVVADYMARNPGADMAQAEKQFYEMRNYNTVFKTSVPGSASRLTSAPTSDTLIGTSMEENAYGTQIQSNDAELRGGQPGTQEGNSGVSEESGLGIQERPGDDATHHEVASGGSDGRANSGVSETQLVVSADTRAVMQEHNMPDLGLRETTGDGVTFAEALNAAKAANTNGTMVDAHTAEQLNEDGTRLFLSANGLAGVAVEESGNITALFKNPDYQVSRASSDLLITALSNGGTKLDCFVTNTPHNLADIYSSHGFKPICWMDFNDEYAPDGWNYEAHGRPDVVFWIHNGDVPATVVETYATTGYPTYTADDIHKLPKFTDYDEAWNYRDSKLTEAQNEQQSKVPGGLRGERTGEDTGRTVTDVNGEAGPVEATGPRKLTSTELERIGKKRHVSAATLGIEAGTDDANLRLITNPDSAMKSAQKRVRKLGFNVVYVEAQAVNDEPAGIRVKDSAGQIHTVRGLLDPNTDTLFISTTDSKASALQILNHETYHILAEDDTQLISDTVEGVTEIGLLPELVDARVAYIKQYGADYICTRAGITTADLQTPEGAAKAIAAVDEEIFSDAFAGIDAYGGKATNFTGAVREIIASRESGEHIGLQNVGDISRFAWSATDATNPNVDSYGRKLTQGMADYMKDSKVRVGVAPKNITANAPLLVVYRALRSGADATRSKGGDGLTFYSDRVQVCLTYMEGAKIAEDAKYNKRIAKMIEQLKNIEPDIDPVTGEVLNYGEVENLKKQIKAEYMKYQQYDPNVRRLNRYHDVFTKEPETYEEAVDYLVKDGEVKGRDSIQAIGPDEALMTLAPKVKWLFEIYADGVIKIGSLFNGAKITKTLAQLPAGNQELMQMKFESFAKGVQLENSLQTPEQIRLGIKQLEDALVRADRIQSEAFQLTDDFPSISGESFHELYSAISSLRHNMSLADLYECKAATINTSVKTKLTLKDGSEIVIGSQDSFINYAQNLWYKHDRKVVYESFLNMKNPYVYDCEGTKYHSVKNAHGSRLRQIAQWAKSTGKYDGCIFTNVIDTFTPYSYLPGDQTSTVLVTFDNSQAKSTANATPTADKRDAWSMVDKTAGTHYTKNVSEVTQQFLDAAASGLLDGTPIEEVKAAFNNLPEIQRVRTAEEEKAHEKGGISADDHTPEAEAYRQEVYSEYTEGRESGSWNGKRNKSTDRFEGPVKAEKKLVVVLGPPASGKSSSTANIMSYKHDAYVMDVDRLVEGHKDYDDGNGCAYVFKDGRIMRDRIEKHAIANGWNVVLPTVGDSIEKLISDKLLPYVSAGYDIQIGYVGIPLYKTLGRALSRHLNGGRYVSAEYILDEVGGSPLQTYNDIRAIWEESDEDINTEPGRAGALQSADNVGEGQQGPEDNQLPSEISRGSESDRLGSLRRQGGLLWSRITGVFQLDNDVARGEEPIVIYESSEGISGTAQERAEVRDLERGARPLPEHKNSKPAPNNDFTQDVVVQRSGAAPLAFSKVDSIGDEVSKETADFFQNTHMREGGDFENNTKGPLTRMYRAGKEHFGYTVIQPMSDRGYPTSMIFFSNKVQVAESYAFGARPNRDPALLLDVRDWSKKVNDLESDLAESVIEARMNGEDYTKTPHYTRTRSKLDLYRTNYQRAWKRYEASSEAIKTPDGTVREEPGIYEAYLNITNPYVVHAEGANWTQLEHEHGDSPREIADWAYENGYDGVIFDRIVDPGGKNPLDGGSEMTEAVVFNSNQIKVVTNKAPTDSPDIRFSETDTGYPTGSVQDRVLTILHSTDEATAIQLLNDWVSATQQSGIDPSIEEKPLLGKLFQKQIPSTQKQENGAKIADLIAQYNTLPEGEKKARDVAFPAKTAPNLFTRKHLQTAAEAEIVPEHTIPHIENLVVRDEAASYERIHDTESIAYADNLMKRRGFSKLLEEWEGLASSEHTPTKHDIAVGELLFLEAAKVGDEATAMKVLADVAAMGTQAGQTVQAMSLLKKMTPSGQLYYLQKAIDRLNHDFASRIEKGKVAEIVINPELARAVLEAKTQEELDAAMDALLQDVADQVPVSLLDKWNTWRYLAMLGNPRTHIRNLFGNTIFIPARFAKDLIAAGGEALFIKDPKQRTKSARQLLSLKETEFSKFAKEDFPEIRDELVNTGKYNPADLIRDKRKIFKSKAFGWINKASDFNYHALEFEDGLALKPAYVSALSQYLAAHNADVSTLKTTRAGKKLLNQGRAYAMYEAQKATYRDFSAAATALNRLKRVPGLNILIDGILPFTKTPINILKRGVEYSPLGLLQSLTVGVARLKTGKITAAEFIDHLAAGLTGTGIAALGMFLTRLTLLKGGDDDDDKQSLFDKLQGYQNYSIQIGNFSYTIDWMAPVALPLFVGCEIQSQLEDGNFSWGGLMQAMTVVAEPMFSLSMLDGLNTTLKSAGYDENPLSSVIMSTVLGYLGQGVPTLTGQLARTIDPDRRKTYIDKNNKLPSAISRFWQTSVEAKVPWLNSTRMAYVDEWGRKDTTGSLALRALENFLSPGYINLTKTTAADEELQRLSKALGNTDVLPSTAAKYFTVNKKRLDLTADQYEQYATERGQVAHRMVSDLIVSAAYHTMTDEQKSWAIENIYDYASQTAKLNIAPEYSADRWVLAAMEIADTVDPVDSAILRTYGKIDENATTTENVMDMDWLTDEERKMLFVASYYADDSVTDDHKSGHEFIITGTDWQAQEENIYASVYQAMYDELVATNRYQNADDDKKRTLQDTLQADAREKTRKQLTKLIRESGTKSTEKK